MADHPQRRKQLQARLHQPFEAWPKTASARPTPSGRMRLRSRNSSPRSPHNGKIRINASQLCANQAHLTARTPNHNKGHGDRHPARSLLRPSTSRCGGALAGALCRGRGLDLGRRFSHLRPLNRTRRAEDGTKRKNSFAPINLAGVPDSLAFLCRGGSVPKIIEANRKQLNLRQCFALI
jgi:hypothetical protein